MKHAFLRLVTCLAALLGASTAARGDVGSTDGKAAVNNLGRASYSIPLQVPPGRLGSEPELVLEYNQDAGNGILGKGWSLRGLSEITRVPATIAQDGYTKGVTLTSNDKYALDGMRLIAVVGATEFRTEVDTFHKVNLAGDDFTVKTADGLTKSYTQVATDGVPFGILKWVLASVKDRADNTTSYSYYTGSIYGRSVKLIQQISYPNGTITFEYEDRTDKPVRYLAGAELQLNKRLRKISVNSSAGPWYDYTFSYAYSDVTGESVLVGIADSRLAGSVTLVWPSAEFSGDVFPATPSSSPASLPGGWISRPLAAPSQDVSKWPVGDDGGVRFLDLNGDGYDDYLYSSQGERRAYLNTRKTDGTAQWVETPAYAPPVDFYYEFYAGFGYFGRSYQLYTGVQFQDLNGDGYVDILFGRLGVRQAYLNNTNNAVSSSTSKWIATAAYAPKHDLHITFNGTPGSDNGVRIVDLNGDGLADYVYARDLSAKEVYLNTGSGWSTTNAIAYHPQRPVAVLENGALVDNGVRFVDVNGDGLTDQLIGTEVSGTPVLEAYLNQGSGFATTSTSAYAPKHAFTLLNSGVRVDGGVVLVDVNGDGLLDQLIGSKVAGRNRDIKEAYLNTGAGWTANVPAYAPKHYLAYVFNGYDCNGGIRFEDVNGDGLPDQVFAAANTFQSGRAAYINTGGGWTNTSCSAYHPSVDFVGYWSGQDGVDRGVRFVELDGDGRLDLAAGFAGARSAYRNQSPAGDLMASVQNQLGARTEFGYGRLTDSNYYEPATTPTTFPVRNLVTPAYVATRLGKSDGVGGMYETTYTYANGRWHTQGRGFLGFEVFESYDTVTGYATLEVTSQVFPHIGMTLSSETKLGTTLVQKITNTLAAKNLNSGKTRFPYIGVNTVENAKDATKIAVTDLYDDYGNVTSRTTAYDGAGSVVTTNVFTNDSLSWKLGLLTKQTVTSDGATSETNYTYTTAGLLESETVGIARPLTTTYERGLYGVVTKITYSGTNLTTRSETFSGHGLHGLPATSTNAAGHASSFVYDTRFGQWTTQTDPNSLVTQRTYDALGRLASQTDPDGASFSTSYALDSSYTAKYRAFTAHNSQPDTTLYFDALHREVARSAMGGGGATRVGETRYYANGLMQKTRELGAVKWTEFTYDTLQRVATAKSPSGVTTTYGYTGTTTGLTTTVDDSGHVKTVGKNARGQVDWIDTAEGAYIEFEYDGNGYPSKTIVTGVVTTYTHDDRGFKTAMNEPHLGAWSYDHDAMGNVIRQEDAAHNVTTAEYDALNRLKSRTIGGQTSTWTYDGTGSGMKLGRLRRAEGPDGYRKVYHYDNQARPYLEITQIDGRHFYTYTTYGPNYSRVDRMDRFWRPLGLEGPAFVGHDKWHSFGLRYDYNADGYTTRIYDTDGRDWWKLPSYDAMDHVTGFTYGNGITTAKTFDASTGELLTALSSVQDLTHTYDIWGNLKTRFDAKRQQNSTYSYDGLNRLRTITGHGATNFNYDNLGNITTKDGVVLSYTVPGRPHAVSSAGGTNYTYDANGNLKTRGPYNFYWTAFNMPSQMQTASIASSFYYDGDFNRVRQKVSDVITVTNKYYVGSGFEQFVKSDSVETRIYVSAPSGSIGVRALLERDTGILRADAPRLATREQIEYYHLDHLGSITAVTNSLGQSIEQFAFDAWGKRSVFAANSGGEFALATDQGYTGHEMLDAHALVHMNGRIYDPFLGRMLSPDRFVQQAQNPQNYNRYTYSLNNPMVFTDPSGDLWSIVATLAFAAVDTYHYAAGNVSGAEYARNMALNGAALVADVATGGMGGGTVLRAGVMTSRAMKVAAQAAKTVDRANDMVGKIESAVSVGQDLSNGEFNSGTLLNAVSAAGGTKQLKANSASSLGATADAAKKKAGGESAAAAAGRRAHGNYGTALGEKYDTKVTLPSGKKPDAVDWANREVRELKPDNPRAIRRGERQVEGYRKELEQVTGQRWNSKVDTYRP